MFAKYYNRPLFFSFIGLRANIVTLRYTNNNGVTKLFSRNGEGMFQQHGARAHTTKATIT